MLIERFRELEDKLLTAIQDLYRDRLVTVAIYGSAARGTQRFDSDIDVLIIAQDLPSGRMKRIREFDAVETVMAPFIRSLRNDGITTYLSAVIKSPDEAAAGTPLFLDMVEDARILYDKEGFFARRLDRLRERLAELGSRRVWAGSSWYWVLKPDYKPGDIIEL